MVSRDLRLRKSFEYDRVRQCGRSWSSRILVLSILENETGQNRYGFAVGKRVGGAVERNRAKRLMREAVRHLHPRLEQGYDVVLIARNTFKPDMKMQEVLDQMTVLAKRAALLRDVDRKDVEPEPETTSQARRAT